MDKEKNPPVAKILRRFAPFIKPYRGLFLAFLAFALIGLAANLGQARLLEGVIDAALALNGGLLWKYAGLYGLVLGADILGSFFITYAFGAFSAHYLHDLRLHAVGRLQRIPVPAMEKRHSGDLLSRLSNDLSVVQDFVGGTLLDAFMQLTMAVAAASYMAWLDWKLLLVSVLPVPLALLIVNALTKNTYGYFRKAGEALGKANAVAQDAIGGILTVKAYNLQAMLARAYGARIDDCVGFDTRAARIMRWTPPFNILLRAMPTVFCIGFGSFLIIRGEMSPGALVAFNFLLGFVQWPLAFLPNMIVRIKHAAGSGSRVAEVLDIEPEREDGEDFSASRTEEALSFEEVGFSYGEGPAVLSGLGFSLREGEKLALVGASGCGKTTVLKLLCGDYESHSGTVRVRGADTRTWNLEALRSLFAAVSQEVFLFPASIRENIGYGREGASDEEIEAAARTANAHEFIMETPEGYETQVGERGVKLSGGQKQRIALARAVLKGSPILLLDEPTSALDTHSEALVQEAIERSLESKTAIIVAHRLSTIKRADRILVIDGGRAAEAGGHEELMAKGGLYAELYARQFNSQEAGSAAAAGEASRG